MTDEPRISRKAFKEGRAAFNAGKKRRDNPYADMDKRHDWNLGFSRAENRANYGASNRDRAMKRGKWGYGPSL